MEIGSTEGPFPTKLCSDDIAEEIIRSQYLLRSFKIESQLRANYDKTCVHLIKVNKNAHHQFVEEYGEKFVLKIIGKEMSKNSEALRSGIEVMKCLNENGFPCPRPIPTVNGACFILLTDDGHILGDRNIDISSSSFPDRSVYQARLLSYVPGETLRHLPHFISNGIIYQMGELLALFHTFLKDSTINKRPLIEFSQVLPQSMTRVSELRKHTQLFDNPIRAQLVNDVISAYEKNVMSFIDNFQKGYLHGDFTDDNLFVGEGSMQDSDHLYHKITGVIDFDRVHYDCLIFDLAQSIRYILQMDTPIPLHYVSLFLKGYETHIKLKDIERKALFYCIAVKLIFSAIRRRCINKSYGYRNSNIAENDLFEVITQFWKNKDIYKTEEIYGQ